MPGTQPTHVNRNTINIEPQPRSYTDSGGKKTANNTRPTDIIRTFRNSVQNYTKKMTCARIHAIFIDFYFLSRPPRPIRGSRQGEAMRDDSRQTDINPNRRYWRWL